MKNALRLIAKLSFAVAFFVLFCHNAYALTLSPARLEIVVNPGDVYIGEIRLLNEQSETKTFYASFENFEASGDTGTPNFIKATEGLATWISSQNEITLSPQEERIINFTINVPQNARPGGHFAAIFWGTSPVSQNESGDISIGARIGALVLLKVNGQISEGGGVSNMSTEDGGVIFSKLPVAFVYQFNNTGDDRLNPSGSIEIRNIFGIKVSTLDANESKGNILPSSSRKFKVIWGESGNRSGFFPTTIQQFKHLSIGPYKATVSVVYGESNTESRDSTMVFIFPWQALISIVVALLIAWIIFVRIVKQRRRLLKKQAELERKIKELQDLSAKKSNKSDNSLDTVTKNAVNKKRRRVT